MIFQSTILNFEFYDKAHSIIIFQEDYKNTTSFVNEKIIR